MIDLRHIYKDEKFIEVAENFKEKHFIKNDCDKTSGGKTANKWKIFKDTFYDLTYCRCPICQRELDDVSSHIDHYRPKKESMYEFLKCCYRNYMIMCSDCNSKYKGDKFPLLDESKRATNIDEIENEIPLLINPCFDNVFDFFEIAFIRSSSTKEILIYKPKRGLNEIDKKRAETTIEIYALNDCDKLNQNRCRLNLLNGYFKKFIKIAKKFDETKNRKELLKKLKIVLNKKIENLKKDKDEEDKYISFYEFILKEQYKILI